MWGEVALGYIVHTWPKNPLVTLETNWLDKYFYQPPIVEFFTFLPATVAQEVHWPICMCLRMCVTHLKVSRAFKMVVLDKSFGLESKGTKTRLGLMQNFGTCLVLVPSRMKNIGTVSSRSFLVFFNFTQSHIGPDLDE